ncbi:MAG: transglutaminase-like domain-containing protein [Gammaproteobacteria bacterium]
MDFTPFLTATATVNADHPAVRDFTARHSGPSGAPGARAVALYYAVRDRIWYDAYAIDLSVRGLSASRALETGRGWCVSKAILLAACCRTAGIPARLGYADVRNHLSTERLRQVMGTDEFIWHGYTDLWLNDRWVKATPAFNIELCRKFRLRPLEFDGRADSIYHPFDEEGRAHMEYLRYRGEFADVPLGEMQRDFADLYPHALRKLAGDDFDRDVALEVKAP